MKKSGHTPRPTVPPRPVCGAPNGIVDGEPPEPTAVVVVPPGVEVVVVTAPTTMLVEVLPPVVVVVVPPPVVVVVAPVVEVVVPPTAVVDVVPATVVVVVGKTAAHVGIVIKLSSRVTAPFSATIRPATVAPVFNVADVREKTVPEKLLVVPKVSELPTSQNTLHAWAPFSRATTLFEAVMSVEPA